uniref:Alpha 1,3-galactosyltransferase 2 n=1 Tax=Acanthochromis polyacanthus TaxID=80966 RepID=A0A3Q1EM05_9TELE
MSAEQHFMLGLPVTYYVFTDLPDKVPNITVAPQRSLKVMQISKHNRWQDISMMRMKTISEAIELELRHLFRYVFCFDVDQEFKGRFGSEALGDSVALYLDAYLKTFLMSAEQHFMLGLPVTYYVFTDLPDKVPNITVAPQRSLKVMQISKHNRWQDISMMRMKTISEAIELELRHLFRYVFCFDVDQEFKGRFGSEALGDSVALLHAHYYKAKEPAFTYDRNVKSKAFMKTGDYYYHAAIFGGTWENVKHLADACYLNIMEDKLNDVEALWHDESHLNKYFWIHKPSKLLSPEYCWDESIDDKSDIHIFRLVWAPKHYDTLRTS